MPIAESTKDPHILTFEGWDIDVSEIMQSVKNFAKLFRDKIEKDNDFKSRLIAKLNKIKGYKKGKYENYIIDVNEWIMVDECGASISFKEKTGSYNHMSLLDTGIISFLEEIYPDAKKIFERATLADSFKEGVRYLREITRDKKTLKEFLPEAAALLEQIARGEIDDTVRAVETAQKIWKITR